ncbi:MAG: hypothetical protein LBV18_02085 [Alistipes sp.]|jgi:hypothetical protein|nr:hypothetical protein [Alistipes sp.]
METGSFIIPNDDSELVEMYFDKEKHTEPANAHGRIRGVLARRLADEPAADPEFDGIPTEELEARASELSRRMYVEAFRCFAERICSAQRSICSHRFMIAPVGGEEGWIEDAPMPCVYDKGRYEMLRDY